MPFTVLDQFTKMKKLMPTKIAFHGSRINFMHTFHVVRQVARPIGFITA